MDRQKIIKLLPLINSKQAEAHRTGWVVARCPFAPFKHKNGTDKNPSFGITVSNKVSKYHCFSCRSSGEVADIVFELKLAMGKQKDGRYHLGEVLKLIADESDIVEADIPDYEQESKQEDVWQVKPFPEEWLSSFVSAFKVPAAMKYLESRGVPEWAVKDLDLRFDSKQRRVCFPIRDWTGVLVGFHGRDITGQSPLPYNAYTYNKWWNRLPWLGEEWVNKDEPVVIVESVFDLASVYRVYKNVLCGLSAGLSVKKVERLKGLKEVVTLYDWGTGGDAARKVLNKVLGSRIVANVVPTEEEKDAGNLSEERIKEYVHQYTSLDGLKFLDT